MRFVVHHNAIAPDAGRESGGVQGVSIAYMHANFRGGIFQNPHAIRVVRGVDGRSDLTHGLIRCCALCRCDNSDHLDCF